MYTLAKEFHYTPDQIRNMDMTDRADLISFWQGSREHQRKQSSKGKKNPNHKFNEDDIIQNLVDQKEREDRKKQI